MATSLQVEVTCDVCTRSGADVPAAAAAVRVALRSRSVAVDLCPEHAEALERALEPVLAAGEARARRPAVSSAFPRLTDGEDREQIRAWALAEGLPVARSGTISAAVLASWRRAHEPVAAEGLSLPAARPAPEARPAP